MKQLGDILLEGRDEALFEFEVLRWNLATVDGNPESPKQVGTESGGTGYANLEVQDYGDSKESYRWVFLQAMMFSVGQVLRKGRCEREYVCARDEFCRQVKVAAQAARATQAQAGG